MAQCEHVQVQEGCTCFLTGRIAQSKRTLDFVENRIDDRKAAEKAAGDDEGAAAINRAGRLAYEAVRDVLYGDVKYLRSLRGD